MNDHVSSDQRVACSNRAGRTHETPANAGCDAKGASVGCPPASPPDSGFTLTEKRCGRCAETLPVSAFNKDRSRANGLQSFCRECQKGNYTRGENRQKALDRSAKYRAENDHARRAHRAVAHALKTGRITKGFCECGADGMDAHHHRGYDYPLDVQWLCRSCHVNLEPRRGAA